MEEKKDLSLYLYPLVTILIPAKFCSFTVPLADLYQGSNFNIPLHTCFRHVFSSSVKTDLGNSKVRIWGSIFSGGGFSLGEDFLWGWIFSEGGYSLRALLRGGNFPVRAPNILRR